MFESELYELADSVVPSDPMFGLTRGEIGLVLFVFALVYGSSWLNKLGDRLGNALARNQKGASGR